MAERPPRPPTPFVGRRSALDRIGTLLSEHRLVTLTGVGGAGKTRLAARAAEDVPADVADDVFWVALAPIDDARLVGPTVCSSLDVRPGADTSPLDALVNRLRSSRAMVVIDNCEHLLAATARLVDDLLEACPGIRILATSREALAIPGEVAWPVPPLSLPDTRDEERFDRAGQHDSVQLFVERARAVRPDFELTPANVAAVAHLCRRLEGIPLALELAATRVRVLTAEQIAERLDEGLALLARTEPRTHPRHHTMRAALAWSHDLLPDPERVLFRRLAAFGGHASLDACEAVCAEGTLTRAEILDLLTRLVEQSLVVVDGSGRAAHYRLLEPVRQFAAERLTKSGEVDLIRERHAAYYVALARTAAADLHGPDRAASLARMTSDLDNLRRAWDQAADAADGNTLAALADALFWFWQFAGHVGEGRMRVEAALGRLPADAEAEAGVDLRYVGGALAWMQGDYRVAEVNLQACVAACREAGRAGLLPVALRELAGVQLAMAHLAVAATLYEESAALLRTSDQTWHLALALTMLGDVREALGDAVLARALRDEARVLFAQVRDAWGSSLAHFGLAVGAARSGDLDASRIHAREALAMQRVAGDDWNIGQALTLLGEVENRAGHLESAGELLTQALEAFQRVGDRTSTAHALLALAAVEAQRGRTLRAVRLSGAGHAQAETLAGAYPYALATEAERTETVESLRRAAGDEAFAEEWARGRAMARDEAVALAVGATKRGRPAAEAGPATAVADPVADLRVLALGPPEVYRGSRRLRTSDWTYALPRELLFNLLLHGPRTREQIGLDFWPEASSNQVRGRFRTALYHLRRALGGTEWVVYENGRYAFDRRQDVWFDVDAFLRCVETGLERSESDAEEAASDLERALDLYRGDFLEGENPGAWASGHQERLRRARLDAMVALGGLRSAQGAHDVAAALYRRAVECEPLHEHAYRELARALARAGNRSGALRHLDGLAERLRNDLDAEPANETLELRVHLVRGDEV